MFDELLGRAALKERIADLEAELADCREEADRLRERVDTESERRSEAVSARQEAEREVNRLEDRIAQLEGELDRLRDDDAAGGLDFRARERLGRGRTETVLDRLESVDTGPEGALTAVVHDDLPDPVREAFGDRAPLVERAAPCVAVADDAGLVSAALSPPVRPDPGVRWGRGFEFDRREFLPTGRFAFALVRSDLFALGTYEGADRQSSEGFRSDVGRNHSKGGFSQGRFERRRDERIDEHLDRCRAALADRDPERLYVVGDRRATAEFAGEAVATAAVDASGDPEQALETAFREFWTTRLYTI